MLIKRSELKELAKKEFGNDSIENQNKISIIFSVAYTARVSYTKIGDDEKLSFEKAKNIYEKCKKQKHFSVFEHIGKCMSQEEYNTHFRGELSNLNNPKYKGWNKNFKGFVQLRSYMENEN